MGGNVQLNHMMSPDDTQKMSQVNDTYVMSNTDLTFNKIHEESVPIKVVLDQTNSVVQEV